MEFARSDFKIQKHQYYRYPRSVHTAVHTCRYANSALAAGIILYICTVPVGMVYDVCTGYSYLYDIISCQKKVVRGSKTTFEAGTKKSSCMNL